MKLWVWFLLLVGLVGTWSFVGAGKVSDCIEEPGKILNSFLSTIFQ